MNTPLKALTFHVTNRKIACFSLISRDIKMYLKRFFMNHLNHINFKPKLGEPNSTSNIIALLRLLIIKIFQYPIGK